MKSKIRVYWYRYDKGHGNFGDELNPFLIERLSGKEVEFYDIFDNIQLYSFKERIHKLIFSKERLDFFLKIVKSKIGKPKPVLLVIGSIISWYYIKNVVVWGSGVISKNDEIYPARFIAVRGKYTQQRLRELGYKAPDAIGDPALLLPLVYQLKRKIKFKLGIIPHFSHYDIINEQNEDSRIKIINLLDPVEKIIYDINSCELTLSTSLHGIIVSHAYRIPSRWTVFDETSKRNLVGDNIKFWDYFSSVNLSEMNELNMGSIKNAKLVEMAENAFSQNPTEFLPNVEEIESIQNELLKIAPFPLKKEFKNEN